MCGGGRDRVGGMDRVGARKYTPLYENGIKKTQNKLMETIVRQLMADSDVYFNV